VPLKPQYLFFVLIAFAVTSNVSAKDLHHANESSLQISRYINLLPGPTYSITATVMMILALFAVGSALYEFVYALFFKMDTLSVEFIFKPIIALTLGLAVFDLGKTIFEQEVLFKSYSKNGKAEYKVLTKFSITILIALLIEALLVVFKISITDYSQMIYAVYLITGVSILVIALGIFIYFTKKEGLRKLSHF